MVCIYIDVCTGVKYLQQSCVFILSCISLKIKHKNGYTLERSQVHLGDDNVAALNNIVILFYSIFLRHGYRQSDRRTWSNRPYTRTLRRISLQYRINK